MSKSVENVNSTFGQLNYDGDELYK